MQTNFSKRHVSTALWISAMVVVGAVSFFSGRVLFYEGGYKDGVIFGDTSGYKRGLEDGYNQGYEYCDSITEDLDRAKSSEQFNLNIIYEELGNPKGFIQVTGEIDTKTDNNGASVKYVKVRINNAAAFARYNEVAVKATFKNKSGEVTGTYLMEIPDVLYPRKGIQYEIPPKEMPQQMDSVEFEVQTAQGMD